MQSKATVPIIIVAVVAVIALVVFMGKTFLAPPAAGHSPPPPWIDPVTNKPKVGTQSTTGDVPNRGSSPTTAPNGAPR
ncbi:MAG: hypothetical protein ABJA67_09175 [Chthonomonadales bacterium]